jgi:hypothetical protein
MFALTYLLIVLLLSFTAKISKLFPHPIRCILGSFALALPAFSGRSLAYEHKVLLPNKHFLELRNNFEILQKTGLTGVS